MKLITTLCGMLLFCAISVQSENLEVSTGGVNKFEEAPENDEIEHLANDDIKIKKNRMYS